jgi:hypothetical protein
MPYVPEQYNRWMAHGKDYHEIRRNMSEYEEFDPDNDPDRRQYFILREQMEFWREQCYNEDATIEQLAHAERKHEDLIRRSAEALDRFNKRCEEHFGPILLEDLDDEILQIVRNKLAGDGMEVTLDELKEALEDEEDERFM